MGQLITCPDCNTVNEITEDQLCVHCGFQLHVVTDEALYETMSVELKKKVEEYAAELRTQTELEVGEIALQFVETEKSLQFMYKNPLILGRGKKYSPTDDVFIDLTPFDAYSRGLSREHARILNIDSGYVIEDLGSSNGTLLNGALLVPKHYYPLHDGDQVALAQLVFVFQCG